MENRQQFQNSFDEICRELESLRGQDNDEANARRTALIERLQFIGQDAKAYIRIDQVFTLHYREGWRLK